MEPGPHLPSGGLRARKDGEVMCAARQVADRILYVLIGIALTVILISVATEVFFRFVLRSSLPWSGELATMGLVWMSLLGGSYAISKKANIRIELLVSFLSNRVRNVLEIITNIALLGLFVTLFVVGLRYALVAAPDRTGALVVSQAYFYASVPVSAVFMFFYTLAALWEENPWRASISAQGGGVGQ